MITYKEHGNETIVILDGKIIGFIVKDADGWRYYPKGQKVGGDAYPTLSAVKRSLEYE